MPRYLFPCTSCDKPFPVATRHAGQTIPCENCEANVDIPKLGVLRQSPEESLDDGKQSKAPTSNAKGWLFAIGLVTAVLAAVAGGALLYYASTLYRDIDSYTNRVELYSAENIDAMKAAEIWDWWSFSTKDDLMEWKEHPSVGSSIQSQILTNVAYGLFGLSGIGGLALLSSFLFGGKRS